MRIIRALVATLALLAVAGGSGGEVAPTAYRQPAATLSACSVPAPVTAAGYSEMFNHLPSDQWGAGDGAETVRVDGRSVWFFGDTFSDDRFVHSTAITQTGGCLHVSHAGAQVLPNDTNGDIYWIDHVTYRFGRLTIVAERMHLTGSCMWCFQDTHVTRAATASLNAAGDVTFIRWVGAAVQSVKPVTMAYPPQGPLVMRGSVPLLQLSTEPHEGMYSPWLHPELRLASGKTLLSVSQNWEDGRPGLVNYRSLFFEVTVPCP